MTDEEINVAIADICGVRPYLVYRCPNYCKDLNLMQEAQKSLKDNEQREYAFQLLLMLCDGSAIDLSQHFILLDASAKQKAEAFLKTFGKWEGLK